jgi:iron only hydrogenase large subunit-like protein
VKAIKVQGGCATVIPETCILCGRCVEACPNEAKRVRDDLPRAKQLLALDKRVLVSLAPSWAAEFRGVAPSQVVACLGKLGFYGVSETALGAEHVSACVVDLLRQQPQRVFLSSACPSAVSLLERHHAEHAALLTPLLSPLLAHCRILRRSFGDDIAIVFIGPCIAKKGEADANPDLLDVVLTFDDLHRWFEEAGIDPRSVPTDEGAPFFVPSRASLGTYYPIEGGMIAGVKERCGVVEPQCMTLSGVEAIEQGLRGVERLTPQSGLFVELLACEGGCVAGPKISRTEGTACKRLRIIEQPRPVRTPSDSGELLSIVRLVSVYTARPPVRREGEIRDVLRGLGKSSKDDELNCGGCGYETCRKLAEALLAGKAERSMCVTYMRKLAMKKANALLSKMPSAVVIVDANLRVVEYNEIFRRMVTTADVAEPSSSLEGASIHHLVDFADLFHSVLKTGEDILDRDLRCRAAIVHGSLFSIEQHMFVGAILQDITLPSIHKEEIVRKAREVIQKNLSTVQQIAYLLGENAAESEIILDSIIASFTPHGLPTRGAEGPLDPTATGRRPASADPSV